MSNVPPAGPRKRVQGRMQKMSPQRKAQRAAKRERLKGTDRDWRGRVWGRKHVISR